MQGGDPSELDVALCLSGQMRTYKQCYGALLENVLDPLNPDVFVHTWEKAGSTTKMPDSGEVREETITADVLDTLYDPERAVIERFDEAYFTSKDGVTVPEALKRRTEHWKGNIPLFDKMKRCNDLKSKHEEERGTTYDLVIKLRPDLIVHEELPDEVLANPDVLWHSGATIDPETQVSDKFAVSSSENMDYYTSVWDHLDEYWSDPLGDGSWEDVRVGERLMRYHMSLSDIPTEPFEISCGILRSREYIRRQQVSTGTVVRKLRSDLGDLASSVLGE